MKLLCDLHQPSLPRSWKSYPSRFQGKPKSYEAKCSTAMKSIAVCEPSCAVLTSRYLPSKFQDRLLGRFSCFARCSLPTNLQTWKKALRAMSAASFTSRWPDSHVIAPVVAFTMELHFLIIAAGTLMWALLRNLLSFPRNFWIHLSQGGVGRRSLLSRKIHRVIDCLR